MAHAGVSLPQDEWGGERVSRRVGGPGYAFRADVTGYPLPWVTHHYPGYSWGYPGAKARRRHVC
jgi:hypothetical protein